MPEVVETDLIDVPPASEMRPGSLVVVSSSGTQKGDLVWASVFWLAAVAGIGFFVGWKCGGKKR